MSSRRIDVDCVGCYLNRRSEQSQPFRAMLSDRMFALLVTSDMLTTRFMILLGSIFWTVALLWPWSNEFALDPHLRFMAEVAPQTVWGLAFGLHAVIKSSSLIFNVRNRFIFFSDALLGCALWTSSTILIALAGLSISEGSVPVDLAAEVSLTLAGWWHLVRAMLAFKGCEK